MKPHRSNSLRALCVAASLLAVATGPAAAATLYWDGDAPGGNGNLASTGGSGTWELANLDWDSVSGSSLVAWSNGANDTAVFGGTAGTVSLGAGITVGGLVFDTAGYSLTGNGLTLAAGSTLAANQNATISAHLAGTSGFTKSGAGTLTLSGINSYTGTTTVSGGTLALGANTIRSSWSSGTAVSTGAGSTLATDADASIAGLTAANFYDIRMGGAWILGSPSAQVQASTFTNDGTTVSFWAAYLDDTFTKAVRLQVTKSGSNFIVKQTDSRYVASNIIGSASFGSQILSGTVPSEAGAYGTTNIAFGSVAAAYSVSTGGTLDLNGKVASVSALTLAGGSLANGSGTAVSLATPLTLSANSSIGGAGNITLTGGATGGYTLTKFGNGALVLGSNQNYDLRLAGSGSVTVGDTNFTGLRGDMSAFTGTLTVSDKAYFSASSPAGANTGSASAAFAVNALLLASNEAGTTTINLGSLSGGSGGVLTGSGYDGARTGTKTFSIGALGTSTTYAGVIQNTFSGGGSTVALTKVGTGTLTLTGNNTYTGGTTVSNGTLEIGSGGSTVYALPGNVSVGGSGTLKLNYGSFGMVYSGQLSGSGAVIVTGPANDLQLAGDNSGFTGTLTVDGAAAQLRMRNDNAVSGASLVLANGGAVSVFSYVSDHNLTVGSLASTDATTWVRLGSGGNRGLVVGSNNQSTTFAGVIKNDAGGTGFLTKNGTGTLTLTGANTYGGTTTLNAGGLAAGSNSAFGTGGITIAGASTLRSADTNARTLANGLTFAANATLGNATDNGALTFSGAVNLGAARTLTIASDVTFAGIVSGSGGLTKAGNGRLTLGGVSHTFTGDLTVSAGTLAVDSGTQLASSRTILASGTTLEAAAGYTFIAGKTLQLGASGVVSANYTGDLTLGGGILALDIGSGTQDTLAVSGALALNSGTIAFSSISGTYAPGTYSLITYGSLAGSVDNITKTGLTSGASPSRLALSFFDDAAAKTLKLSVTGSAASLTWTGAAGAAWDTGSSSAASWSANGAVSSGDTDKFYELDAVTFADGAANRDVTLAGALNVGTITFSNATDAYTFAGAGSINGIAAIAKSGAGLVDLGVAYTGSGGITVSAGTLRLSAAGVSPGIGAAVSVSGGRLELASGASLGYANTTVTGGTLSATTSAALGSGSLALDGGTLEFAATGTYAKALTVDAAGGTLDAAAAGTTTYSGALSGSGALTKAGNGTLSLTADNAFAGDITVSAGTLALGGSARLGNGSYAGVLTLASGAGLAYGSSASQTLSGKVTGAGTLSVSAGTLTLSNGNNDYSGATTVSGGSLVLGNAAALGASAVTLSGGGQLAAAGAATVSAGITLGSGGGNLKGGSGDYAKFTGRVTGGTAGQTALTINQGYVWLDSDANDFAGNISITGYYLKTGRSEVLPDGTVVNIGSAGGMKIQGAAGNYVETIGGINSSSNYGVWAESAGVNATLRIGSGNVSSSYGGGVENLTEVGGATLALVKIGTGTLTLTSNAGYSAGTTLSAGTLVATAGGALGSGAVTVGDAGSGSANASLLLGSVTMANAITVANHGTGTFTLGANGAVAFPEFSGAITLNRDVVLDGSTNTDRMTFSGGIGGAGGVTVRGTQRVLFRGSANTFGGGLTIDSGAILQLDYGTSTATSYIPDAALVTVNGTLIFAKGSNSETIGGLAGSGSVLGHPAVASTASSLVLAGSGSSSFSGTLVDGGAAGSTLALAKSGSGTQELTNAANSFTGGTSVTGGILSFANGALGASGTVSVGGGTLRWASGNTQDISGRLGLVNGQAATLDTNGNDVTLGTAFGSGSTGALSKAGAGTLTLGAANSYTGGTTIAAGTVALGAAGALGSGGVTVTNGGALSLGGHSLGSASLTLSGSGSGAGALVNDGSATTLNGTVTLAADATLGGTGDITLGGTLTESSAGRTLTKAGSGTLNLDGVATLGALDVSSGLLVLNGSLAGDLTIDSGATLGGSGTITGAVTISGAHNPGNSPGVQTINGSTTYTAGSTIGWELIEDADVQGFPIPTFDQIIIGSGNLSFTGATTVNLSFNGNGSTVDWSSLFWDSQHSWVLFDVVSGSISGANNLALGTVSIDSFGATLSAIEDGAFSVYQSGNTIVVTFTPVPEPSTYGLALGALALAGAAIRRRRAKRD